MGSKALFLDRDGVITQRAPEGQSIILPEQFKLLPGVVEAVKLAKARGYLVIVITNQSCVGRKLISEDGLKALHEYLRNMLSENGNSFVDAVYYCPTFQLKTVLAGNQSRKCFSTLQKNTE